MQKINITSLVTMVSTLSLLAVAGLTTGLTDQARAQNKPWNQQDQQKPALPQTTKLQQNDNLDPTVNRTQAMRTEAETGSIAPITGKPAAAPVTRTRKSNSKVQPKSATKKKIWHMY
jgi:K+-sensing histidine kinase KdpD